MRWLILPPSADRDLWLSAIQAQAASARLKLAQAGKDMAGADLVITEDASLAVKAGASPQDMAVLLSHAGPLPDGFSGPDANPKRHPLVMKASELIRRAMAVPAERRFGAEQVRRAPVAPFEDFSLHIPELAVSASSARNRALLQAMAIYDQDRLHWSPDVLDIYSHRKVSKKGGVTVDVTGKPRFLAHGPYITMPAGHWKAVIRLSFPAVLCDKAYRADWGGVAEYSQLEFRPDKPGIYEIEMDWLWQTPAPCEIRLLVGEGVFDGDLVIHDIAISRIDQAGPSGSEAAATSPDGPDTTPPSLPGPG